MASTFSTDLKIELMATGENSGTWGTKTNTNLDLVQQAIVGFENIAITSTNTTLLMTDATISPARNAVLRFTGTITANCTVFVATGIEKTYSLENATSGAFTLALNQVGGASVIFGATDKSSKLVYLNGTDAVDLGIVNLQGTQTLTNKTLTSPKIGTSILDTNGNELALLTATGSAVNEITLANAATGNSPTISATGSDSNVGINLTPKGTGGIVLPAGAVGTPALTTSGDLNTGIFFPSADTIAFTEGGDEAMRITSDGDLLVQKTSIGTSTSGINSFDALYSFDSATVTIATGGTGSVKYSQSANTAGSALAIINAYNVVQGNENRGVVLFLNFRNTIYPGGTVINTISTAFADSGVNGAITNMTFAIDAANSELDISPTIRGGSGNVVVNVRFIGM